MGRPPLVALMCLLTSGCDRLFELSPVPDAIAPPDAEFSFCYGNQLSRTCLREEPTEPERAVVGLIDTDDAATCTDGRTGGQPACVIAATDLAVNTIRVSGSRPLVLLATSGMEIDSTVDVASTLAKSGPAAPETCGENAGSSTAVAGGGGAGGSFIYRGGAGGGGGAGAAGPVSSLAEVPPVQLVGGCPGGAGGRRADEASARGGRGGGAIAFVAGTKIGVTNTAIINASGAAGGGGAVGGGGGGGGGAGGMILFDAPLVELAGDVFARGSGGGGGGGTMAGGVDGGEPISAGNQPPGSEGGSVGGANGGAPSGPTDGKQGGEPLPSIASSGGGGGGGSGGYIVVYGELVLFGPATNPVALDM